VSEGSVFRRKDGRFCAKYEDATGKARYLYRKKSKSEAKQALREALKDRDEGIVPETKKTVAALLDEWLEGTRETVSRRTWIGRECMVRVHLKPSIGTKRLAKLTPEDIHAMYRCKLAARLAPSTVKRLHIILKQALPTKYMSGVKPPKVPTKEMDVLTPEQVLHLLEIVRGERFECVCTFWGHCVAYESGRPWLCAGLTLIWAGARSRYGAHSGAARRHSPRLWVWH
jgi:integrase